MSGYFFKQWPHTLAFPRLILAFILCLTLVPAQDKKQTKTTGEDNDVIKVTSNLVSLDVTVKDKKGKAVTDLKPEDFTVIENGIAQKIEFFDSTLTTNEADQPDKANDSTTPASRTRTGLPRNIIALVLDGQSTQLSNLKHVREGIVKYIRERISDSDSVALLSISGGLQLLQPFTQDKARLIAAVEKAYNGSTVSKSSEARDISENISSLRDQIAGGVSGPIAATPSAGAVGSATRARYRSTTRPACDGRTPVSHECAPWCAFQGHVRICGTQGRAVAQSRVTG